MRLSATNVKPDATLSASMRVQQKGVAEEVCAFQMEMEGVATETSVFFGACTGHLDI